MGEPPKGKLVVKNIGLMLSGDIGKPILDADTIVSVDGRISAFGKEKDVDTKGADRIVDAMGTTLAPGLIDSHVHPVFGDWTPRQQQFNWIDSFMNGGVTTMISAGEVHLPGRPKEHCRLEKRWRSPPSAPSTICGRAASRCTPARRWIEKGMIEEDFKEMAAGGVKLLGEVGLGGVKQGEEAKQMVAWARKHGIQSTIHTGGPSIPGSGLIDKDVVLEADADVIGHINGGHTALPLDQIRCLCEDCSRAVEIVPQRQRSGRALCHAHDDGAGPDGGSIILGTDSPAGSRCSAARHSPHDRHAEQHRRSAGRNCDLFRHR